MMAKQLMIHFRIRTVWLWRTCWGETISDSLQLYLLACEKRNEKKTQSREKNRIIAHQEFKITKRSYKYGPWDRSYIRYNRLIYFLRWNSWTSLKVIYKCIWWLETFNFRMFTSIKDFQMIQCAKKKILWSEFMLKWCLPNHIP